MKTVVRKTTLLIFVTSICSVLQAQTIRWANGEEKVRQLSKTLYEPVPAGVISYKIENNQFWRLWSGVPETDSPQAYVKYADNEYFFYTGDGVLVGSYIPSQKRYYIPGKEEYAKSKEAHAVLHNRELVVNTGGDMPVRYTIDDDFDPVAAGFFLFFL